MINKAMTPEISQYFDFENLPDEVLQKIFFYLFEENGYIRADHKVRNKCQTARVNKKFKKNLYSFFENKLNIHFGRNTLNIMRNNFLHDFSPPEAYFNTDKFDKLYFEYCNESEKELLKKRDIILKIIYLARENDTKSILSLITSHEVIGEIFEGYIEALLHFLQITNNKENHRLQDALYQMALNYYQKHQKNDFSLKDHHQFTLLDWAIMCHQSNETITDLIKNGYPLDDTEVLHMKPLFIAATLYNDDALETLINFGAKVINTQEDSSILDKCFLFSISSAKLLIEASLKTRRKNDFERALFYAAAAHRHDICQLLLDHVTDLTITNDDNNTALHMACDANSVNLTKYNAHTSFSFYRRYVPPKNRQDAIDAIESLLKLLIERGANVNLLNEYGYSPLMMTVESGLIEVSMFLIKFGADVNQMNERGKTPLLIAVANNNKALVKILIDCGADVNKPSTIRVNPILLQYSKDPNNIKQLLIERGIDLNYNSTIEVPILSLALDRDLQRIAQCFGSFGFKQDVIALQNAPHDMVQLLIENGAQETIPSNLTSKL